MSDPELLSSTDLDRLPCGVIQVSGDRCIVFCNREASRLLGSDAGGLAGQRLEKVLSAASRIFVDSYVYPLLIETSIAEEIQLTLKTTAGERLPVVANILAEDDRASVWSFTACHNRNALYEELLQARDSLSFQAKKLSRLNKDAYEENENLKVFCRSLSHDFTAPIRRARQMLEILIEELENKGIDIQAERKLLDRSIDSLKSLMTLVEGLVQFLIADSRQPEPKVVDMNRVLLAAVRLNEGGKSALCVEIADALPPALGNSAQLQVLFKNLIANSIKYNENPPKISITCDSSTQDGMNIFSLKDNGIGIDPEFFRKIFEPFSRLHTSKVYEGSGLGLSIVSKLVIRHGGSISVESTPGHGSVFHVSLPVVSKSAITKVEDAT